MALKAASDDQSSSSDESTSSVDKTAGLEHDSRTDFVRAPMLRASPTVLLGDSSRRSSIDVSVNEFKLTPSEIADIWIDRLGLVSRSSPTVFPEDMSTIVLDEPNQRVIKYDCERTRGTVEDFKQPSTRDAIERILTFYCKNHNVSYKQGMNEVLAPFVALKLWGAIDSWSQVYTLYAGFIELFLDKMFCDEEFVFLQKCCILFRTCLRYHAPSLSARLDAASVTPEMYVTPWFLTLFASKSSLPSVLHLWHLLITSGDKHSFVFVAISLCLSHARILRASAKVSLPETITKISVTEDAVGSVWKRSLKIRQHTPPFFLQQLLNASEGALLSQTITAPHLVKQLGDVFPMTVRPMDLFRPRTADGWKYVVLDCRPDWMISSGHIGSLPLSIPFDLESLVSGQNVFPVSEALKRVGELLSVDVNETVPQWPLENHICIMGLADAVVDATGLLYVALSKFSNVPRVSLVKGGYLGVHNEAPQELIDHNSASCPLCNGIAIQAVVEKPITRARAGSTASSIADSSGTSSPGSGGIFSKLRSFVAESSSVSFLGSGSRFVIGAVPPIPTSKAMFVPKTDQYVCKCRLVEVMGRTPGSDLEANALIVVGTDNVTCFSAPLDMTILSGKCELRQFGSWRIEDVTKITSKTGSPDTLMLYFSVETAPDLVLSFINADTAKIVVNDVRKKFRTSRRSSSSE